MTIMCGDLQWWPIYSADNDIIRIQLMKQPDFCGAMTLFIDYFNDLTDGIIIDCILVDWYTFAYIDSTGVAVIIRSDDWCQ